MQTQRDWDKCLVDSPYRRQRRLGYRYHTIESNIYFLEYDRKKAWILDLESILYILNMQPSNQNRSSDLGVFIDTATTGH